MEVKCERSKELKSSTPVSWGERKSARNYFGLEIAHLHLTAGAQVAWSFDNFSPVVQTVHWAEMLMGMRTWVWETGGWPLGQGLVQTFCSWVIVTRAVWCKISASGHVFFIGQILPREKNDEAISGHVNTFSKQTSFHHLSPSPHWSSHTALRFLRLTQIAHISLAAADDTSLTLTPPSWARRRSQLSLTRKQ